MHRTISLAARGLTALAIATPLALHAQGAKAAERGGFVVRLGADTMVVERYVRTADRLEAWSVNRQPVTIARHYVVQFDAKGNPTRMDYEGGRVDGAQPMNRIAMEFGADTTTVTIRRDTATQTLKMAGQGMVPQVGNSFALTELAIARFLAAKADSVAVPTLPLGAPRMQPLAIKRVAKNTLHVDYFGAPWVTTVDAQGRITGVDGSQSAGKITVTRVADIDVDALTKDYAARDKAGKGFGVASPGDSVRASIGSAQLAVKYSRPARRGRALMGNLVPVDGTVWRTGANAATVFTTSTALDIGGTTVPAGSYTLWTLPSRNGWQLIVNKQTGQWGTAYDATQDFARIPMTVNKATGAGPEAFTIAIEPKGADAGLLRMTWGDIDVSVPVTVKAQSASN